MKMTLLEMVQAVLNTSNSDEVNSIQDTVESNQVVEIIENAFYEILTRRDWPWLEGFISLENSVDTNNPTRLKVPDNVSKIDYGSVFYNKIQSGETRKRYEKIKWLDPDHFLMKTNGRDNTASDVITVTADGADVLILNDAAPTYFTSFNDDHILCDSYDVAVDSTLQASKFQIRGVTIPTWTASDTFTPDMPAEMFPLLLAEVKSVAAPILTEQFDQKAEQAAQRANGRQARNAWRIQGGMSRGSYGRRSVKSHSPNPPFKDD